MSTNAFTPRNTNWDGVWGTFNLGLVNEVDPDIKLVCEPITRGTTGKVELGDYAIATAGMVKFQIPDINPTLLTTLNPWMADGDGQVLMPATPNKDMYAYAQILNLHPHDIAAGTVTEDLNFVKAVPMSCINIKRDGQDPKKGIWEATFKLYPDRTKLFASPPKLVYGYLGAIPS